MSCLALRALLLFVFRWHFFVWLSFRRFGNLSYGKTCDTKKVLEVKYKK